MKKRKFQVHNKLNGEVVSIEGETELAKYLNVKIADIPRVRIFRVTFGNQVVTELQ